MSLASLRVRAARSLARLIRLSKPYKSVRLLIRTAQDAIGSVQQAQGGPGGGMGLGSTAGMGQVCSSLLPPFHRPGCAAVEMGLMV